MQWAHLASGGAGGGMRWPNRTPHTLTPGMRRAQASLSGFLPLIDWSRFKRRNLNREVKALSPQISCFACGDEGQAVVWLLRRDITGPDGMLRRDAPPLSTSLRVPGLVPGRYRITAWNTQTGEVQAVSAAAASRSLLIELPPFAADLALAIRAA
jgi:mannan endo-1,4-beta-mannosidase